jgi:biotin synthase
VWRDHVEVRGHVEAGAVAELQIEQGSVENGGRDKRNGGGRGNSSFRFRAGARLDDGRCFDDRQRSRRGFGPLRAGGRARSITEQLGQDQLPHEGGVVDEQKAHIGTQARLLRLRNHIRALVAGSVREGPGAALGSRQDPDIAPERPLHGAVGAAQKAPPARGEFLLQPPAMTTPAPAPQSPTSGSSGTPGTPGLRHDWTLEEARAIHDTPLFELVDRARAVHRAHHPDGKVQLCTLLSVKTGGCPEDCAYCPQSSHHEGGVDAEKMLDVDQVLASARRAKEAGSTRFCMGAAWREVKDGPAFDKVVDMVRGVKSLGLEACATLGMLNDAQAKRLAEAGLDAYNHNLDTSRNAYKSIINTRTYDDRLATLKRVRGAGITVCSGGIIGMGESIDDRVLMLIELAKFDPHPESVPINALVRVPGTPLAELPPVTGMELVRMVATARLMMPLSRVRLSAGRTELSEEAQLLALYAGANSIFYGDKLLTTPNPESNEDAAMLKRAGLQALAPAELAAAQVAPAQGRPSSGPPPARTVRSLPSPTSRARPLGSSARRVSGRLGAGLGRASGHPGCGWRRRTTAVATGG